MKKQTNTLTKVAILLATTAFLFSSCIFVFPGFEGDAELTLELTWDGNEDLDLYLTYPNPTDGDTTDDTSTASTVPEYLNLIDAYDPPLPVIATGDIGFAPEDIAAWTSQTPRGRVFQGNTSSVDGNVKFRNYSESETNREVIRVLDFPFNHTLDSFDFNTTGGSANGLSTAYDYAWVGIMEAYVWGVDAAASAASNVEITVYDSNDEVIGVFPIPDQIYVDGAALVRIPLFRADDGFSLRNVYQVLGHTEFISGTSQIRGAVEVDEGAEYGVIGVVEGDVQE